MLSPVIREMTDQDAGAWDHFVRRLPGGTFFHLSGWRRLFEDVFHLDTRFLLAERAGEITAILPLVHQRSWLFGNTLVATPFCAEAGPLASDLQSLAAIDEAACALMDHTGAIYLEYRSRRALHPDWPAKGDIYATFARAISQDKEENLQSIARKQRAVIRKALDSTLVSRVDERVDRFYDVYAQSLRNLGTPVFPKRYFTALQQTFGDCCDIVVISEDDRPLSAVMNFYFKDTVMPYYGGGIPSARLCGANHLLYWDVLCRAAKRGYKRFDFGRSKAGTGAFSFKRNWGFDPEWLEYEYRLRAGVSLPQKHPSNPKFFALIALWKRLPMPVANFLGPLLVRHLG